MYRTPKKKVDVSVADVVLEAINQGAHKKVADDTEEPKTIKLPVPASSASNAPDISIADIILNTETYTALHGHSSTLPAGKPSHSTNRATDLSPKPGRPSVRTSPPGKSRSLSLGMSILESTPPNRKLKGEHPPGFMHTIRTSSKGFLSRLRKSLYPRKKQP